MWFDMGISTSLIWESILELRRITCQSLVGDIENLEVSLAMLASGWFPVKWPRAQTPQADWAQRLLQADGVRSLRFQGALVMSRRGGCGIDEILAPLERLIGPLGADPEVLLKGLAAKLEQLEALRSLAYGALTRGVSDKALDYLQDPSEGWRLQLLQGSLDEAAWWMRWQLHSIRQRYEALTEGELGWTRSLYAALAHDGAADEAFAELLESRDQELLEFVMSSPSRPRRLTWQNLVAGFLRVVPNVPPYGDEWWLDVSSLRSQEAGAVVYDWPASVPQVPDWAAA